MSEQPKLNRSQRRANRRAQGRQFRRAKPGQLGRMLHRPIEVAIDHAAAEAINPDPPNG